MVESAVNNQVNLLSMKTITTIKSFVAALVCCIAVSGCSEKTAPEHVQAVDLGLSVKWASCNIGADSPEDFGQYFAWGETEKKTSYSERNSKTCNCGLDNLCSNGYTDDKGVLTPDNDAAREHWGEQWRMPTDKDFQELLSQCIWKWTKKNGKNGFEIKGPNGNTIFLPAAGNWAGNMLEDSESDGHYWTSTVCDNKKEAWHLYINSGERTQISRGRELGLSIRPVSDK